VLEQEHTMMKIPLHRLAVRAVAASLLLVLPVLALARPTQVQSDDEQGPGGFHCPHCGAPIAVTAVGDYALAFSADLDTPQMGLTQLSVGVTDRSGEPVNGGKVIVTLSMPGHSHRLKPMTLLGHGGGRYYRNIFQVRMPGLWKAEVAVTTARGETVKQAFTFRR
jgi:hypothetical protein